MVDSVDDRVVDDEQQGDRVDHLMSVAFDPEEDSQTRRSFRNRSYRGYDFGRGIDQTPGDETATFYHLQPGDLY